MLFTRLIIAAVAVAAVSAVPVPCESEDHAASKTANLKPSSSNVAIAKPTTKAAPPPAVNIAKAKGKPKKAKGKPAAKAPPAKSSAKASPPAKTANLPPPPPAAKSTAAKSTAAKSTAAKSTAAKSTAAQTTAAVTTTTTTAAANTAAALPPAKNTATDSGVAGVIEGCVNPDGVTECFQILNILGSCFSIPRPLANNVGFFLPPPAVKGVPNACTLFTDEDCKNGGEAAAGQVANIAQNSFICNATAAATTTTAAADTTTTTTAAANTALALPPPKNTATDSGVTGVIEGCVNPDGVTECFQILNILGSCFSIPRPLANNVAFFLPPPPVKGVANQCTLFSDEDCKDAAEPVLGQAQDIKKNSFICNATAAAA